MTVAASFRRGVLIALPVAVLLAVELGFGSPTKGALASGAFFTGLAAFDAPAGQRARWQLVAAILLACGVAIGILTASPVGLAVAVVVLIGGVCGLLPGVSTWAGGIGVLLTLSVLLAQGMGLPDSVIPEAMLYVAAGGATQALWSAIIHLSLDRRGPVDELPDWAAAKADVEEDIRSFGRATRHACRMGLALAAGVVAYHLMGFDDHGFWIPLTAAFALRPQPGVTGRRLVLRAVGTPVGLALATLLVGWAGSSVPLTWAFLTVAVTITYGSRSVIYGLFPLAMTVYMVLLDNYTGTPVTELVDQRLLATAIGIAIAAAAWLVIPAVKSDRAISFREMARSWVPRLPGR